MENKYYAIYRINMNDSRIYYAVVSDDRKSSEVVLINNLTNQINYREFMVIEDINNMRNKDNANLNLLYGSIIEHCTAWITIKTDDIQSVEMEDYNIELDIRKLNCECDCQAKAARHN